MLTFIVLNIPLISEVVRKYIIPSNYVFLVADLIVISIMIYCILKYRKFPKIPHFFYFFIFLFSIFCFITALINPRKIIFFIIGLRACFFPLVYMAISSFYIQYNKRSVRLLYIAATVWILIAGTTAVFQLLLGPTHAINSVWGVQGVGIGDYSVLQKESFLPGLFRPTSIFMHTGKFGQTIFLLVLFRWIYLIQSKVRLKAIHLVSITCDLIVILISGQRSALIFIALSGLIALLILGKIKSIKHALRIVFGTTIVLGLAVFALSYSKGFGTAAISRIDTILVALPIRFYAAIKSLVVLIENYALIGVGFGFFTLGSGYFGGMPAYEGLKSLHVSEGTPPRIIGEIGFMGSLMLLLALITLIHRGFIAFRKSNSSSIQISGLFFGLWGISMIFWSLTHDVFANTVSTFTAATFSGGVLVSTGNSASRKKIG